MDKNINPANLPDAPGCYIFRDSAGDCLYVGKSKRVKSRVRSYFNKNNHPKIRKLAKLIAQVEYRAATNEIDALYLEHSLIKTYRPPFNSQMKKDPHPHYICIEWGLAKPGLYISNKPGAGAVCYGGFNSVYDAKIALALISRAWHVPSCESRHFDKHSLASSGCLNLHIGQCLGPCQPVAPQGYRENLIKAAAFMQGRSKQALLDIKREMNQAAQDLDFEKAAKIRDMLKELQYLQRRFTYRVPFAGRRLCVLIKGYHEPEFLLLYYKNGQFKQGMRLAGLEDWPKKRDGFILGMLGKAETVGNLAELAKIYTPSATQEIRARKLYIDMTKTCKAALPGRLDKAMKIFTSVQSE